MHDIFTARCVVNSDDVLRVDAIDISSEALLFVEVQNDGRAAVVVLGREQAPALATFLVDHGLAPGAAQTIRDDLDVHALAGRVSELERSVQQLQRAQCPGLIEDAENVLV